MPTEKANSAVKSRGVSILKVYVLVFVLLTLLTLLTVGISRVDLTKEGNIIIGLVISSCKACLVALFFMHLKYDGKVDKFFYAVAIFPLVLLVILVVALLPDIGLRWGQPDKTAIEKPTIQSQK